MSIKIKLKAKEAYGVSESSPDKSMDIIRSQLKEKILKIWKHNPRGAFPYYDQLRSINSKGQENQESIVYTDLQIKRVADNVLDSSRPDSFLFDNILSEKLVFYLKNKVDFYRWKNHYESIRYAEAIISVGQWRSDSRQIALGLMSLGDCYAVGMTDLEKAWKLLSRAARLFSEQGDLIGWARTTIGRVGICIEQGCINQSLADAKLALEIFKRYDEKLYYIRLSLNIMRLLGEMGRYKDCLEQFHRAKKIAMTINKDGEQDLGYLYINVATSYKNLGEFTIALQYYSKAREILKGLQKNEILNHIDSAIAYIHYIQGNYHGALEILYAILASQKDKNNLNTAMFKRFMIECYLSLGHHHEALELSREVLQEIQKLGDKSKLHQAHCLRLQGIAQKKLGRFGEAEKNLLEAIQYYNKSQNESWQRISELILGEILLQQAKYEKALKLATISAQYFYSEKQLLGYAQAHQLMAKAHVYLKNYSKAKVSSKVLSKIGKSKNIMGFLYTALTLQGQLNQNQGRYFFSRFYYQKAFRLLIELQQNLTITLRPGFLIDKINAAQELIKLWLIDKRVIKAFIELEQLKSMTIMSYLMNRQRLFWSEKDPQSMVLLNELNYLRKEHFSLYNCQQDEFRTIGSEALHQMIIDKKVKKYERKIRQITEKLYLINAKQAEYTHFKSLKWEIFRKKIPENVCLLEYFIADDHIWVFIIKQNYINVEPLNVSQKYIKKLIDDLYQNITFTLHECKNSELSQYLSEIFNIISEKLYKALLGPVISKIPKNQQLWLVPFGLLHYVPFATFFTGKNYLIEERPINILPAAGWLTRSQKPRKPGIRILAHSNNGKLPYVYEEVRNISNIFKSKVYLDKDAVQSNLTGSPVQILHIAAHGWHRPDQPGLSCILLEDGYLNADDLLQKDLDYELVTLSACESGKKIVSAGEELLGLIRGVLYAGAQSLLLSYWRIHDELTSIFMNHFYNSLKKGKPKNIALQEAQLTLLGLPEKLHPAYWGAFQLIGDPGPLSQV